MIIQNEVKIILYKNDIRWIRKLGEYEIGAPIFVNWKKIKSTSFRNLKINIKCDDCGKIQKKRLRDIDESKTEHFCRKCSHKGDKNPSFGRKMHINTQNSLEEWRKNNINPFETDEVKKKIKEINPWKKIGELNKGKKRSDIVKKKMSESAILCFKNGKRSPNSGWSKIRTKEYKGLKYQSSYELRFLKYLESIGHLDEIENGPYIEYKDVYGNTHLYFIDFKVKNKNIVFEIKSTYYWNKKIETNKSKKEEAEKIYQYHLILDNKFDSIKSIFNEV